MLAEIFILHLEALLRWQRPVIPQAARRGDDRPRGWSFNDELLFLAGYRIAQDMLRR
jgi:hypothetical protein